MVRLPLHPLGPLVFFFVTLAAIAFVPGAFSLPLFRFSDMMFSAAPFVGGILILMWMQGDARQQKRELCFDFGLISLVFFPLSVVWYCVATRRWGGLLWLLGLYFLWMLPVLAFLLAGG